MNEAYRKTLIREKELLESFEQEMQSRIIPEFSKKILNDASEIMTDMGNPIWVYIFCGQVIQNLYSVYEDRLSEITLELNRENV